MTVNLKIERISCFIPTPESIDPTGSKSDVRGAKDPLLKKFKIEIDQGEHVGPPAAQPALAMEPNHDTDLNPVSKAPNLRFPIPGFFTDDPDLWFFQLEATFIVNRVTTEKDKYAVVVANLPYSVV